MEDFRNILFLCQEKITDLSLQRDINNLLNKPRSIEDMIKDEVRANATQIVHLIARGEIVKQPLWCDDCYEYLIVSEWLYIQLKHHDEWTFFVGSQYFWGRTCTGQAIYQDNIIKRIYAITTGQIA